MCIIERRITALRHAMDQAWDQLNAHRHPRRSLTEADEQAFDMEHEALALRFAAACHRYKDALQRTELDRIEQEIIARELEEAANAEE